MIVAIIVLGVLCVALIVLVVWKIILKPGDSNSALLLKADLTQISENVNQLKDGLQKQLTEQLGSSNKQMAAQYAQSARIIREVTKKLTELDSANKNVGDIAGELKPLQNVLQNPKQRGVLGEFYLEQALKNMLPPGTDELQYKLGEGLTVDAVIKLGDKLIPIDSKFSLENYNRLVEAKQEEKPPLERAFKDDLKKRIDETAKYIRPNKGTLDLAMMYIPSEGIYYA